jgi:hypothetical protein
MSDTEIKEAVLKVIRENPECVIEALGKDFGKATRGTLRDAFAPLAAFGRGEPKHLGDFFKDMREVVVGLKSA